MKYTIVRVNDRAKTLIDKNKKILNSFEYVDSIKFFNANLENPWDELANRGIDVSTWRPYDGRTSDPLPGELGIWLSFLNIFEYMTKTNTQQLLVLEDDAKIKKRAPSELYALIQKLPKKWDFLSLHFNDQQNNLTPESDIGLKKIHKSINQFSSTVAVIYSYSGAQKLLELVKEKGIEYTLDCFLYHQAAVGLLNGYSIIPSNDQLVSHEGEGSGFESIIDPTNLRHYQNWPSN
jgi:GR25 family glycosyltransferase involved in LPS biosynthesis